MAPLRGSGHQAQLSSVLAMGTSSPPPFPFSPSPAVSPSPSLRRTLSLPAPPAPSRSLFPPSPSRFLSGRRRFGPAPPPSSSLSGCGKCHGGGFLNVSDSEAPCCGEWGCRGPPVAGQFSVVLTQLLPVPCGKLDQSTDSGH
ncbi:uncharacterized protein ACIBXB_005940 isoform 1-T2 [Morphnus guianensis]